MYDIIFIAKAKDASFDSLKEKYPLAKYAATLDDAKRKSSTKFFWAIWPGLVLCDSFKFDYQVPEWDKDYIHIFKNGEHYDGICIFSKTHNVSVREITHRFFIHKKEIDIVASHPLQYEIFNLSSYEDYLNAVETSSTDMFWAVWGDVIVNPEFKFDHYIPYYDSFHRNITHVFRNNEYYDGICLFSKSTTVSSKEFNHRFFIHKKEMDVQASSPKPYDIVFISYQEPNAEDNWNKLKDAYPRAMRVHGVKGIHQAHIEAAKLASTDMFWVVDGDAVIEESFKFEFEYIPFYNLQSRKVLHNIVHVWKSRNPINNLTYGYGGIKLLPRLLTLNMDVTNPDMTTSISTDFKPMPAVSNITAFNTDPFNTWKSAFRECVKLASRTISGQVDTETEERLTAWCTLNVDAEYGNYAYLGALAGRKYGQENASNKEALSKINDFTWLQDQMSLEKFQQ
jgi:hypothetical protein